MNKSKMMRRAGKVFLAVLLMLPLGAFAQVKFGHVNTQKILEIMPEVKNARAQLDTLNKNYEATLKELYDDYQKKVAEVQDPANKNMPDAIKNEKIKAIQQLQDRIQSMKELAQSELQKKQEDLMSPITKKVADAIKDVATTGKYSLIVDSSVQAVVLYAADSDDLTDTVKKKLGLLK